MIAVQHLCQGMGERLEGITLLLKNRIQQLGGEAQVLQSFFIHILKLFHIKRARLRDVVN